MWPHRWQPTRLPCPWDSPGKNTGVGCHFLLQCMKVKSESEVAQSCPWDFPGKSTGVGCHCLLQESESISPQLCPTLWHPIDCSLPGFSAHGILQARILMWVAIPFPRGSSQSRDWTQVSCIASGFFTVWATRETPKELEGKVNTYDYSEGG